MLEDGLEWWSVHLVSLHASVGPQFVLLVMCWCGWTVMMRGLFIITCLADNSAVGKQGGAADDGLTVEEAREIDRAIWCQKI
jgi:hypothetical protein